MELRPNFKQIKSFKEFSKYYWYREELQKICKSLGLDSSGMKAELNHVIEEYFKGNLIYPKKGLSFKLSKSPKIQKISLQRGLIESNFSFSQRFRDFFAETTGIKPFKFNVDMVATARKVRECGDTSFTLGDLLDIFYGRKTYAKYDKVSLQWNKFVKDFCADPATSSFPNKLKAASALWKEVRESTREKIYRHELLEEFFEKEGEIQMTNSNALLQNLKHLHTTPMGIDRIRRNLSLGQEVTDVVVWCREKIQSPEAQITRQGKNWYVSIEGAVITVNAYSYTIITAHKQ